MTALTPHQIRLLKATDKIVCLTAYTAPMARILAEHVNLLLVGDSVGMVLYGMETTLGVDLDMMIRHGQAVMRGANGATCVIVDMPYGTYEHDMSDALRNARRIIEETGAAGVKLEGGADMANVISHLTAHGIEVMAHIGLQPQSVEKEGGYKIKGKTAEEIDRLLVDIHAVETAGAFSVVIEGTLPDAAEKLSQAAGIPTIGIGASAACDGQILVSEDMLGASGGGHIPKFVKQYADIDSIINKAAQDYAQDVRSGSFPSDAHVYKKK